MYKSPLELGRILLLDIFTAGDERNTCAWLPQYNRQSFQIRNDRGTITHDHFSITQIWKLVFAVQTLMLLRSIKQAWHQCHVVLGWLLDCPIHDLAGACQYSYFPVVQDSAFNDLDVCRDINYLNSWKVIEIGMCSRIFVRFSKRHIWKGLNFHGFGMYEANARGVKADLC